jgi:hypothetical protein
MEARAAKAVAEFIKNPEAVSKKTEEAIKHLGVGPNRHSVEKLAHGEPKDQRRFCSGNTV